MHDRDTGKLIRFSEAMIPQENMWVLPTQGGRAHAARRERRRRMVADGGQPEAAHGLRGEPAPADDLPRRGSRLIPAASCGWAARSRRSRREKQWGRLVAVNLDTGKVAWKAEDATQPLIGGVLATAGDLVFTGEGNGWFKAFDAKTARSCGRSTAAPASTRPPCRTWSNGKQYVAVAAGGNNQLDFKRGNSVFVFALP